MLGMSMGHSPRLGQSLNLGQRLEQRLTMKQTLAMRQRMFGTYISFLRAVRGEQYQPHGDCPRCNKKLSLVEIMKGFRNDATDYTTKCPKCKTRFEPQMILRGNYGSSV